MTESCPICGEADRLAREGHHPDCTWVGSYNAAMERVYAAFRDFGQVLADQWRKDMDRLFGRR